MSETAKADDTVRFHYSGARGDGSIFESSLDGEPLEATIGAAKLIADLDGALIGMAVGEQKVITVAAADAYGNYFEERIYEIERSLIPDDVDLVVGEELPMRLADSPRLKVMSFDAQRVKLDANHPLAGEDLTFELTLIEII
mgnify:CR=1 FL=1|tara:strand:+ start:1441 stop:1866 length:426 start_codon:yes stop_codon:yes gene_type:complete